MLKVLAARVVVFSLACIWVMGWLANGLIWYNIFLEVLGHYGPSWVAAPLLIWYIATLILVGIWIAVKGFKFIGRWEKDDKTPS